MELLARGLEALGVGVTRFGCEGSGVREELALAEAFERASEFDLIHTFVGERALLWAPFVAAPILSTIETAPGPDRALVHARLRGRTWFVATRPLAPGGATEVLAVIAPPAQGEEQRVARAYLAVYTSLLELDRKRRMDSGHDRRPWGEYRVLVDDPQFKVKRIDVLAGKRLSYQRHRQRSEHWTVVCGTARVTLDGKLIDVQEGGSVEIPIGAAHRVENPGPGPLTFIEVQRGSYFGEDDIERLSDDFGRA